MISIHEIWLPFHSIIKGARKVVNDGLRPFGLSSAEGNILLHMFMQSAEISQEQLACDLGISKAAISRVIDGLEKKGYILRTRKADDRRFYQLLLTEKAREATAQIARIYNGVYDMALRGISEEEFAEFTGVLEKILKNFDEGECSGC